jgi:hypothetical protein
MYHRFCRRRSEGESSSVQRATAWSPKASAAAGARDRRCAMTCDALQGGRGVDPEQLLQMLRGDRGLDREVRAVVGQLAIDRRVPSASRHS